MDDKSKDWVDFAKAKAVRFEIALEALGLLGSLRRDGEQLGKSQQTNVKLHRGLR